MSSGNDQTSGGDPDQRCPGRWPARVAASAPPVDDESRATHGDRAAGYRYLTLKAARSLECNGCGDCCDSRRTDGGWAWGALPADEYAERAGGLPLIIPLERTANGWRDRPWQEADAYELSGTRFRCSAFRADEGGERGACTRHDQWRPPVCHEFPVWGDDVPAELAEHGESRLPTDALPRCTWFRVIVVPDDDPRATGD